MHETTKSLQSVTRMLLFYSQCQNLVLCNILRGSGNKPESIYRNSLLTQGQHQIISVQKQNLYPAGLFINSRKWHCTNAQQLLYDKQSAGLGNSSSRGWKRGVLFLKASKHWSVSPYNTCSYNFTDNVGQKLPKFGRSVFILCKHNCSIIITLTKTEDNRSFNSPKFNQFLFYITHKSHRN